MRCAPRVASPLECANIISAAQPERQCPTQMQTTIHLHVLSLLTLAVLLDELCSVTEAALTFYSLRSNHGIVLCSCCISRRLVVVQCSPPSAAYCKSTLPESNGWQQTTIPSGKLCTRVGRCCQQLCSPYRVVSSVLT